MLKYNAYLTHGTLSHDSEEFSRGKRKGIYSYMNAYSQLLKTECIRDIKLYVWGRNQALGRNFPPKVIFFIKLSNMRFLSVLLI